MVLEDGGYNNPNYFRVLTRNGDNLQISEILARHETVNGWLKQFRCHWSFTKIKQNLVWIEIIPAHHRTWIFYFLLSLIINAFSLFTAAPRDFFYRFIITCCSSGYTWVADWHWVSNILCSSRSYWTISLVSTVHFSWHSHRSSWNMRWNNYF